MTVGRKLVLDCIIFGLQRYGGISNYWARLLDHVTRLHEVSPRLILPKHVRSEGFNPSWAQGQGCLTERLSPQITRYLFASVSEGKSVFHTSYYRIPATRVDKYVVSAYDFIYERYRKGLARYVHSVQKASSLRRADAVICISDATRRDVLEFCRGIDPARLHVTHLGVDAGTFYPDVLDSTENEATVLFVGQRAGYKRFDLAIDAVRQCPRLRLGIVGPPLTSYERQLLSTRLESRWTEFGSVSAAELRRLYSSVFAFIFPSDYEGFGLPVLEAMASGCPVVAANSSSLPEVGSDAALYASMQRADDYAVLLDRLFDTHVRAGMVNAGIRRAAEFTWRKTFDKTVQIYLSGR
jgi:mannosyltransferase